MRRALLVCLMLMLPLQWGWAAAAAICKHEASGPSHFGHHEHKHDQHSASAVQPDGTDTDCATCHGTGVPALMVGAALTLPALVSPPPATAPQRWVQRAPDNPLRPPLSVLA